MTLLPSTPVVAQTTAVQMNGIGLGLYRRLHVGNPTADNLRLTMIADFRGNDTPKTVISRKETSDFALL